MGARPERAFVAPAATTTILFKIGRRGSPGNERRAFLLLCVLCVFCVYDDCVDFCDVTMTHEHRRNALAPLGRCPPFRNIETPFCSATLCRTRLLCFRRGASHSRFDGNQLLLIAFCDPSHRSVGLKGARRADGSEHTKISKTKVRKMPTSIQQVERHYFRFPGPFFAEQLSVASCLP